MRPSTHHQQSPSWSAGIVPHSQINVSSTPLGLPPRSSTFSEPLPSPFLYTGHSSESATAHPASSPNYFGFVVDSSSNPPDSSPGPYTKKNWDALAQTYSLVPSPRHLPVTPNLFQDQVMRQTSEFTKGRTEQNAGIFTKKMPPSSDLPPNKNKRAGESFPVSPGMTGPTTTTFAETSVGNEMDIDKGESSTTNEGIHSLSQQMSSREAADPISSLAIPRSFSPGTYSASPSHPRPIHSPSISNRIPNLSLPSQVTRASPLHSTSPGPRRAETLPVSLDQGHAAFVSAEKCAELLGTGSEHILLLDVRPYPQFAQANIVDSLNLCIPTTLLKRPSFNTDKLKDTFASESEKRKFSTWKQSTHIIVYDANTDHPRDTAPLINVLKKFRAEGWHGEAMILRGGFAAFASRFADRVSHTRQEKEPKSVKQPRSMSLSLASAIPISGGCSLPDSAAAEPFFGNIRQNMDLVGGVGQIRVKGPENLADSQRELLPSWLRKASDIKDEGRTVSQRFLKIEERELLRMREALTSKANYDQQDLSMPLTQFRVAGIEKGSKNRYNDIYPFDHSRVRLQNVPSDDCDYVNANHVQAEHTKKNYIATQAPVPDTFIDFWRVVWEQDVRVIVALTAEVERGQIKCHPYWKSGDYGHFKVKNLGERRVSIDGTKTGDGHSASPAVSSALKSPASSSNTASTQGLYSAADDDPFILVRHFTLSHSAYPFQPIREITQLQYSHWPDFGTISQPTHLLKLVEQCNKIARMSSSSPFNNNNNKQMAEPVQERPMIVHCSAGCGRTGTFCTVDSVLDILKHQWAAGARSKTRENTTTKTNTSDSWLYDDSVDLVAETVEQFRKQRPSMVQNLSQFVLCYESILEWVVSHLDETRILDS